MTRRETDTAHHTRAGFTLVELLIALVLFAIVAGIATRSLRGQRRFLRGAAEVVELRSQLRQAVHLLPAEVRALSPEAGDIHEWHHSALAFRTVTGSSVLCRRSSDSSLILPPLMLERGNVLTMWHVSPEPGDSLHIFDDGTGIGNADDTWRSHEIAAVTTVHGPDGCSSSTRLTVAGDEARPSVRIRVSGNAPLAATLLPGAPVRIFHRVRYELYRGGDSRWYIGASDCNSFRIPSCATIQPVSGPYRPRAAGGGGLSLAYFDRSGRRLEPLVDDARTIARVEMVVRSETHTPFGVASGAGPFRDSMMFTVAVRNRRSVSTESAP